MSDEILMMMGMAMLTVVEMSFDEEAAICHLGPLSLKSLIPTRFLRHFGSNDSLQTLQKNKIKKIKN